MNNEEVIKYLNANIVKILEEKGFKYNPNIDINNYEHKKFFVFKPKDYKIESLEGLVSSVNWTLNRYIQDNEELKDKQIEFNLWKLESLKDKDSFSELFRGLLLIKTKQKSISNYDKIKSMTIDELAEMLAEVQNENDYFCCETGCHSNLCAYRICVKKIKQWLMQEVE